MALDENKNATKLTDNEAEDVNGGNIYLTSCWECQDCYYSSLSKITVCPECGSTNIRNRQGF